jgi:hypothetical protein
MLAYLQQLGSEELTQSALDLVTLTGDMEQH